MSRSGQSTIVSMLHPGVSLGPLTINRWISPSLSGLYKAGQSQAVGLARPVPYRPSGVLTGACITAQSIARTRGPRASHWPMCATGCEQPEPSLRGCTHPFLSIIHPQIDPDGNQADLIRQDLDIFGWALNLKKGCCCQRVNCRLGE